MFILQQDEQVTFFLTQLNSAFLHSLTSVFTVDVDPTAPHHIEIAMMISAIFSPFALKDICYLFSSTQISLHNVLLGTIS